MDKERGVITFENIYENIINILEDARRKTYRAINFSMVQAYWHIGRLIVEEEQKGEKRAEYGNYLIKELSKKLTEYFGKGFTTTNLKYFRKFYLTFPITNILSNTLDNNQPVGGKIGIVEKSHALRDQFPMDAKTNTLNMDLSWTHYRLLLKVEKTEARNFYIDECIQNNWSTRQLERQINSFYYERILSSRNKQAVRNESMSKGNVITPKDIIKDPYVLEFLDLQENKDYLENDFEQALIDKLQDFLLELGKGFSFVARQKRITVDGDHFYIDLVFYNYFLKCFILVDIKVNKLTHQDIGQMDFYVRYFEKEIKLPEDNPAIGLILCAEKNEAMAKYTLLEDSKNIFASKYKLYLPTEAELQEELEREKRILELEMGEFCAPHNKKNGDK